MSFKGLQTGAFECSKPLRKAVSRSSSDRASPAHNHIFDRQSSFAEVFRSDDFEGMRQKTLFDQQHRIAFRIERDGAVMTSGTSDSNVHLLWGRSSPPRGWRGFAEFSRGA